MQESILLFFQRNASPFWDGLFHFFSFMGEPPLYLLILGWLIWNGDKKRSFAFCFVLMYSVLSNLLLKIIFRHPRPFQSLAEIEGKRLETAGGYSFPSGHTQNAATFYFSWAAYLGKAFLLPIVFLIVAAIALSRLYLGVHWPQDVAFGFLLGVLFPFLLFHRFSRIYEDRRVRFLFLTVTAGTSTLLGIGFYAASFFLSEGFDLGDIHKFSMLTSGLACGYLFEYFYGGYSTDGTVKTKILRYAVGLIPIALIYTGIKFLLPEWGWLDMIRYFAVGLTAVGLIPWCGVKLKLFQPDDACSGFKA